MVDWSFNHRTGGSSRRADNSDSDSENADIDGPCDVSSLLRDIDLSSRRETVDYKPNPWSIAKINARSRDSHPQSMKERSQLPSESGTMPTMGPIGAAVKKQADRAQNTPNGGRRVLGENSTKVCSSSCGQTDKACRKVVDTPKSRAHALSVPSHRPEVTRSEPNAHISPSNDATRSMRQVAPIVARPSGHASHAHEAFPYSTPSTDPTLFPELPCVTSLQNGSASKLYQSNILPCRTIGNDIPVRKGSEISARPRPTRSARSPLLFASQKKSARSIHSPSPHPIIHPSSDALHVSAANDQDRTLPVAEPFGRPCPPYSPPPRHAEQACLPMQSLSVPAVDSPATQGATDGAAVRTHEQILQPHANHVVMYPVSNVRRHAPRPGVTSVSKPRVSSISHFCLTGTERNVPPFLIEDEDAVASRNPPKRSTSPIGGFSTSAKRARIQTRLPSPTSSPLRPRPPPYSTSSPKSVGAYRFGAEDSDPDASWSTFSATRFGKKIPVPGARANKPQNGPNDGIKKSGTFRLPGVGLGRRVKFGGSADASPLPPPQDQKRRVITYLPPPLQMPNTEDGGASDKKSDYRDAKRGSHKLDACTRTKDAMIKCHVLLDSEATGGASATTTEHEELDDNDPSTMVPLIDSDDATLVGEEYDLRESSPPVTAPFDIDDVSVRYPQLRTKIKEVRVPFPYDMASPCLCDVSIICRGVRID